MAPRQIDGEWYVDFYFEFPGQPKRRVRQRAGGAESAKAARDFEADLRASMYAASRAAAGAAPELALAPTFMAYTSTFLVASQRNKRSSFEGKVSILNNHLLPAFGMLRLDEITDDGHVEPYVAAKRALGLSNKTVNNHLIIFNALMKRAYDKGVVAKRVKGRLLPVARIQDAPVRYLDFDETNRLIAAAATLGDPWFPMIVTALKTGLRVGELMALEWTDVDLKAGRLVVRRSYTHKTFDVPKSGKNREIPLAQSVVDVLVAYRHLRGPLVFCREDGGVLSWAKAKWWLGRAVRKAGVAAGNVGWHDLRHTFASHLAMRGVPMRTIQELMGHADMMMTMRYSKLSPAVVRDAVNVLDGPAPGGLAPSGAAWPGSAPVPRPGLG